MFDSCQDSLNCQNIMIDEISESGKLHHVLTDVHLENKAGISSQVRFKLDTVALGNLLPVSVYHELFPDFNMKDLGKTIDKSVQLPTATKLSIKQLSTVHFQVYHSQCNFPYTCLFFIVQNKHKPILGCSDLMQLNLVSFIAGYPNPEMITHCLHLTSLRRKLVPSSTRKPLYMGPDLNQSCQVCVHVSKRQV